MSISAPANMPGRSVDILLADLFNGKRDHADLLVVDKGFDPVGPGHREGRVEADRDVTVPLRFTEERDCCFRLGDDLFFVRVEKPDLDVELTLAAGPLVHDGKSRVYCRKGIGVDSLEEAHEAELSTDFLTNVIAEEGIV